MLSSSCRDRATRLARLLAWVEKTTANVRCIFSFPLVCGADRGGSTAQAHVCFPARQRDQADKSSENVADPRMARKMNCPKQQLFEPTRVRGRTPARHREVEIIDKLVEGSIEVVNTPSVKEKLVQSGIVPGGTMPAQVAERFKADRKVFADAVQIMGRKPE
jgi:hypothetical protein